MDRVHALLDAWMKNGEITLPHLTQRPPGRKDRVKMPVPPNHLSPDQRLPGAVLRNEKMKNGEILTTEPNVEEAPFPDHQNNAPLVHVRSQRQRF